MKTKEIRQKLIIDFGKFIQDDTKLHLLEGVFDAIKMEEPDSIVPDSHYQKVAEIRAEYHSGNSQGSSWEEVEKRLIAKYGL